ncbi:uncharacterized protein LOC126744760 [Anthonomus grandis grandis]|uniref:uncharacterized protein LOC126744760 n=1 Tax=Anthonomus grandis grandis TaxID=2921223 RepID=UPI002165C477|nr:uncharacterized protein LOC126744760 [Anthonomus grandis grandis]
MEEILIETVKQHDCLYNHSSREYRDQRVRQESWEEIGRQLKITPDKAKQMWDKLRRCFNNARNRRLATKSGQATKNITPWKFEQQMAFLLPYLEGRRMCGNLENDVNDADNILAQNDPTIDNDNGESDVEQYQEQVSEQIHMNENTDALQKLKQKRQQHKQVSKKNTAAEVVQIMQENSNLRKRKYEDREKRRIDPGHIRVPEDLRSPNSVVNFGDVCVPDGSLSLNTGLLEIFHSSLTAIWVVKPLIVAGAI